jgi:hypothetical protein
LGSAATLEERRRANTAMGRHCSNRAVSLH